MMAAYSVIVESRMSFLCYARLKPADLSMATRVLSVPVAKVIDVSGSGSANSIPCEMHVSM